MKQNQGYPLTRRRIRLRNMYISMPLFITIQILVAMLYAVAYMLTMPL